MNYKISSDYRFMSNYGKTEEIILVNRYQEYCNIESTKLTIIHKQKGSISYFHFNNNRKLW